MKRKQFFVACDRLRSSAASPELCKGEPLEAGTLANSFLDSFLGQEQRDAITLGNSKALILPGKLKEKISIAALSRETLILKTGSSVWRAEALAAKMSIIAASNRILGRLAVKNIKFG